MGRVMTCGALGGRRDERITMTMVALYVKAILLEAVGKAVDANDRTLTPVVPTPRA